MHNDLQHARNLLDTGDYTCVVCRDQTTHTAVRRGVRPLLDWLDSGLDLQGFSAADRVVGRATAYLYCLLGVRQVYARVMSHPAAEVLTAHGIGAEADSLVEGIINRAGTGPCPFEAAVMDIHTAPEALSAIRKKMQQLQQGGTL